MSQKLITVFGAGGLQGGSVARALAKNGFKVRGVTSNCNGTEANDLRAAGIEVVEADYGDMTSLIDSLRGAYGSFVVTNTDFNDPNCLETEEGQGKNIADACKKCNLQHVVYSTLFSPKTVLGTVARHADAKESIEKYMREIGLPLSCIFIPFAFEYLLTFCKPEWIEGDTWRIRIPMGGSSIDGMCINDTGMIVNEIFMNPSKYMNKTVAPSGDKRTVSEMAAILNRQLHPKKFFDQQITMMQFRDFKWAGAKDIANYLNFISREDQQKKCYGMRLIHPGMLTFEQWVVANRDKFENVLYEQ